MNNYAVQYSYEHLKGRSKRQEQVTKQTVWVTHGHAMGSEDTLYQDDSLFTLVRYCRADQPNYLQKQHAAVQLKLSELF